jgi:hypothetical protein
MKKMTDPSRVRTDCVHFYLCTQLHCTRNLVQLKIHAADTVTRELNGPALAHALQKLVVEKDLGDQVQVRETSCMRGCLVGPRLNVVGGAGFKDALRYLQLPAAKRHLKCSSWGEVSSLEEVLDQHVEERRLLRLIT